MCTSAQFKSASPTYKSRTRVSSPSLPASPPLPRFSCQFVHFQFSSGRVETACRARETAPQDTTKCRRHRGRPPCTAAARPLFECARARARRPAPGVPPRPPTNSFRVHFHCRCHLYSRRATPLRTDHHAAQGAGGGSLKGKICCLYLSKIVLYLSTARTLFARFE